MTLSRVTNNYEIIIRGAVNHGAECQMSEMRRHPRDADRREQAARLLLARAVRHLLCSLVRDPLDHRASDPDPVRLVDRNIESDRRQGLRVALKALVLALAQNVLLPRLRVQFQSVKETAPAGAASACQKSPGHLGFLHIMVGKEERIWYNRSKKKRGERHADREERNKSKRV